MLATGRMKLFVSRFLKQDLRLGPQLLLSVYHLVWELAIVFGPETVPDEARLVLWSVPPLAVASIAARLSFLRLLLKRSIDERCFMLNVMSKTVAPIFFGYSVLGILVGKVVRFTFCCLWHLSFLVVLLFASLGIRGTLRLPCGKLLIEVFLSRNLHVFNQGFGCLKKDGLDGRRQFDGLF